MATLVRSKDYIATCNISSRLQWSDDNLMKLGWKRGGREGGMEGGMERGGGMDGGIDRWRE